MTKSALSGPLIIYGDRNPLGAGGSNNPDKAPSIFWGGAGIMDHRSGYNLTKYGVIGWYGPGIDMPVVDAVPSTISAVNIAASQSVTAGTAMTLVSTTGAGITVLATATTVWASGTVVPANALALDGPPGLLAFGLAQVSSGFTTVSLYDPSKSLARNIRITTNADDTGGTYVVAGYDLYGYAMTETITGVSSAVASGKKAFKFVTSITPAGTINSTAVTVGTGDVFGFPIRIDTIGYIGIDYNASLVTANTGFTAAVTTAASSTTGDVRGTYALQTASNNTRRLQMFASLSPVNIQAGNTTAMFGVAQA